MTLKLYIYPGEENRVNKSSLLTEEVTITGTLRDSCDILNPSIIVETLSGYTISTSDGDDVVLLDDDDLEVPVIAPGDAIINNTETIRKYTYAYITEFDRYYFIINITSIRQNLWMLSMRVDTLMSHKTNILSLYGFVTRNQYLYNPLIKDDIVSYVYNKDITEVTLAKGDKVNTTFSSGEHTRNFLLSCTSFNTIPSTWQIDAPDASLPTIKPIYYSDQFSTTAYVLQAFEAEYVTYQALKHSDTVGSYIKSLIAYPYDLTPNTTDSTLYPTVYVGETEIKDVSGQVTLKAPYSKYRMSQYLVIADFTLDAPTSFLDYEPYTQYELYIPYCTWISVESNKILGKEIIVYYAVSYDDGSANAYVYNVTDDMLLWTGSCQLGVRIGITTTNNEQLHEQRQANTLNMTLGLLSSAASVGIGVVTENPVAVVGGVLSGAKSVASYINNNSLLFDRAQATYTSGQSGMYSSQDVRLRKTKLVPRGYDANFAKLYGKPLNQYKLLSSLSGYTQVADIHLENVPALPGEKAQITSLLATGVIF